MATGFEVVGIAVATASIGVVVAIVLGLATVVDCGVEVEF